MEKPLSHALDYHLIRRSHFYRERRNPYVPAHMFGPIKQGDCFFNPFCGSGDLVLSALHAGARVVAGDVRPKAIFLTKVLIESISLFAFQSTFNNLKKQTAGPILDLYQTPCPQCGKKAYIEQTALPIIDTSLVPDRIKPKCPGCGFNQWSSLPSTTPSDHDFAPWESIPAEQGKDQTAALFTARNFAALNLLYKALKEIAFDRLRRIFLYAFSAVLYDCSRLKRISSSSFLMKNSYHHQKIGRREIGLEENVWHAFEKRVKLVYRLKNHLNTLLGSRQTTDSMDLFMNGRETAFLARLDRFYPVLPEHLIFDHVFLDFPGIRQTGRPDLSAGWDLYPDQPLQTPFSPDPVGDSVKERENRLYSFFLTLKNHTGPSSTVILSDRPEKSIHPDFMRDVLSKAGYDLSLLPENRLPSSKRYVLIQPKKRKPRPSTAGGPSINELKLALQAASFLSGGKTGLHALFDTIDQWKLIDSPPLSDRFPAGEIKAWIKDKTINEKAYRRICLDRLTPFLQKAGFIVTAVDPDRFVKKDLTDKLFLLPRAEPTGSGVDFAAANGKGKRLFFSFFNKENQTRLQKFADRVRLKDRSLFNDICCLILPSVQTMGIHQAAGRAKNWPRGFFIAFEELVENKKKTNPAPPPDPVLFSSSNTRPDQIKGTVTANQPVGRKEPFHHYMLTVKTPRLGNILPGQFIMIDTLSDKERKAITASPAFAPTALPTGPKGRFSFLKRPFGIYRVYYPYFDNNGPAGSPLSAVMHKTFPDRITVFYKVLKDGIGTNELTRLKKGESIRLIGPLGRADKLFGRDTGGVKEIHLVGGGVGAAPLVFFCQELLSRSFQIKVFIGISDRSMIQSPLSTTPVHGETISSAGRGMVDELIHLGLNKEDIFLSFERTINASDLVGGLPDKNIMTGLITDHYQTYLQQRRNHDDILVVSCGPDGMMKKINETTSAKNIPLSVLLERRMGCGIGVCMSCVCKTKSDGKTANVCICTKGPLFDAREIIWDP